MAEPHTLLHSQHRYKNPSTPNAQKYSENSLNRFLYRALFFIVFIALLPFFPSQSSENTNQSILSRSWELLQLLFVGVVISYGFFSCQNTDTYNEKELQYKAAESLESYVSQILHGSSVFYDNEEAINQFDCAQDENKVQTWDSQHNRNQPVTVVANGDRHTGQAAANKSLLLPIRSLRPSANYSFQSHGDNEFKESLDTRDDSKDDIVLRSPIPWRSRSGKTELKDESEFNSGEASSSPRSLSSAYNTDASRSSRTNSPTSWPKMKAKSNVEYSSKKNNRFFTSSPPPAPPPPPPFLTHGNHQIFNKPVVAKCFKDELKDMKASSNTPESPTKPRSVRTVRSKAWQSVMIDTNADCSEQSTSYDYETQQTFMPSLKYEQPAMNNERVAFPDDLQTEDGNAEKNEGTRSAMEARTNENEVDKKADEFIAKFREQIRLQRIDSIKRSTMQRTAMKTK